MTTNDLPGAGKRVALFATCVNDVMFPETPKAVVRLLERLGCEVDFPPAQTCCGQMFTNTGYADEAIGGVRQFVDVFSGYDAIVAPSEWPSKIPRRKPIRSSTSGSTSTASRVM